MFAWNCRVLSALYAALLVSSFLSAAILAEPISTGIAIGSAIAISSFFAGYGYVKCKFYECCDKEWVPSDMEGLRMALERRVYGQHLVQQTVVRAMKAHLKNPDPKKALVLSFHGWTGGGKNFVSSIIAEHLFRKGMRSQFLHLFVSGHHFPHTQHSQRYQEDLRKWIQGNVTLCSRSLFIFDELDKIPPGVLDAVKPFLDYYSHLDGVDFRKSIFLFLSNTGGNDITQKALEHWKTGRARETIQLKDMENVINMAAFNEEGGLRFSALISNHLVDHFIPFLPLEREHVRSCVGDYFYLKNRTSYTAEQVQRVVEMLEFFPRGADIYSTSGCKRVAQKVELLLQEEEEASEDEKEQLYRTEF